MKVLWNAVELAQMLAARSLVPGDQAVDATAGNGKDTLWLAKQVGETGKIYAFDIQEQALARARERLKEQGQGLLERILWIQESHEHLQHYVSPPVGAVMFNLGYLPGSDQRIITKPESTIKALKDAWGLLKTGGVVTLVIYTGHPGGEEEKEAVYSHLQELSLEHFSIVEYSFLNSKESPPRLVAVERK